MSFFSTDALNPGVRKREVFGWAMFDFANSGYTTVVLTAVFAAYFVGAVADGAEWAAFAWTAALSLSHLIVMLTIPAMGAWADQHGAKKRLLMFTTAGLRAGHGGTGLGGAGCGGCWAWCSSWCPTCFLPGASPWWRPSFPNWPNRQPWAV